MAYAAMISGIFQKDTYGLKRTCFDAKVAQKCHYFGVGISDL